MAARAHTYKLSRQRDQRRALRKSMADALILQESITTTRAKAKALRPYVEKLITKSAQNTLSQRRLLRARVNSDEALDKLMSELGPRYAERPGGYTRLEPVGYRRGDNTQMMSLSLVDADSASLEQAGEAAEAVLGADSDMSSDSQAEEEKAQ